MSHTTQNTNLTEEENARAAILRRMLKKRAADNKQLREEELSQVVPTDQRHNAREMLQNPLRDPQSPIISPGGHRDVYVLESLEAGAEKLHELTGEEIDYRSRTHDLSDAEESVTVTVELSWDTVSVVENALAGCDANVTVEMQYDTHPPAVILTGVESALESIAPIVRDATNGDVEL